MQKEKKIYESIKNFYQNSYNFKPNVNSRRALDVEIRQFTAYILHKNIKNISMQEIAKIIGKKSHSTIIHSIKSVNNQLETDKRYKEKYEEVLKHLRIQGFLSTRPYIVGTLSHFMRGDFSNYNSSLCLLGSLDYSLIINDYYSLLLAKFPFFAWKHSDYFLLLEHLISLISGCDSYYVLDGDIDNYYSSFELTVLGCLGINKLMV